MRNRLVKGLLTIIMVISILPCLSKTTYADASATEFVPPEDWENNTSEYLEVEHLPGFVAIPVNAATTWTGALKQGSTTLIYGNPTYNSFPIAEFTDGTTTGTSNYTYTKHAIWQYYHEGYRFYYTTGTAHTVTFDPANGKSTFTQTVPDGEKAVRPSPDPANDNWTLYGWYVNPVDLSNEGFSFDTKIKDNLTLKAVWEGVFTMEVNNRHMGMVGHAKKGDTPVAQYIDGRFSIFEGCEESHGTTNYYDVYSFTAEPDSDYRFVKWIDKDGKTVSADKTITNYKCTAGGKLTAVFEEIVLNAALGVTDRGKVQVTIENPDTIEGPGARNFSTELDYMTLNATGSDGSLFSGWYEGTINKETGCVDGNTGTLISEDPELKIYRDSEYKAVQAVFVEDKFYSSKGDGQSYQLGSSEGLSFVFKRSANDKSTFDSFQGIEVDGADVEKKTDGRVNYTAERGSVVITLQPAYLDTLSEGKHTLTAVFTDKMIADASFTITKKSDGGGRSSSDTGYSIPKTGIE